MEMEMEQVSRLYDESLKKNQEAFTHCLFAEAHQALSITLNCAFDLRDIDKLSEVERRTEQQVQELEEHFSLEISPFQSPEMRDYRQLVGLASIYQALLQEGRVVVSHSLDGHKFEEVTTIDPDSGTPQSLYTIDNVPIEPGTWESKRQAAQQPKTETVGGKEKERAFLVG
ncbi:MAG: hypothetical protein EOP06_14230 [Proteobacteria bacterium]|nr:MAG: hypothetical protein EOP06_14230 [Pseudomonadota bacterium]